MPIVIDGYNLLWAITKMGEGSEAITDVGLCRVLGAYLKAVKEKGQIVFDGVGPPDKSGFDNIRNLEVVFTGRATDADTVIEDKIRASTAPKRLTIVSSDQRLRKATRARRAVLIKSDMFWVEVKDKDDAVVLQVNGPDPAGNDGVADVEPIQCGNIYVPHKTGGNGGKGGGKP